MLSRIQSFGSCLIVLTLLLFAGSAGAQDVSPRCEASMDRAAGHYSKCLLSADASNARHKNPTKLANRQARCETRFDRRTSRAINRHGAGACPSSDLVAAMADRTVTYAEGAATEAGGTPAPVASFCTKWHRRDAFRNHPHAHGCEFPDRLFQRPAVSLCGADAHRGVHRALGRRRALCRGSAERRLHVHGRQRGGELRRGVDFARNGGRATSPIPSMPWAIQSLPQAQITCDADSHLFIDLVEGMTAGLSAFGSGLAWYLFDFHDCDGIGHGSLHCQ